METRLRMIHLDGLEVAVWLATTKEPPAVEWTEACAKLAASVRAAGDNVSNHRIFVVSDGASPNATRRKELFDQALRGHPVPTAVINRAMANPVRRAMAAAMNLLKPHYRVFEPQDALLAVDHIGVERTRFEAIWKVLRFLQESLSPVTTLRLIAEELHLPMGPLRPSQIPPSSPPPAK